MKIHSSGILRRQYIPTLIHRLSRAVPLRPTSLHRRVQSSSSALRSTHLSQQFPHPLTPTYEEPRTTASTPGGSGGPGGPGGFFSSVFSAAQNAASSLGNTIANSSLAAGNRSRSGTQTGDDSRPLPLRPDETAPLHPETDSSVDANARRRSEAPEVKRLAVETLGMGDLSLTHLGIAAEPADDRTGSEAVMNGSGSSREPAALDHDRNGAPARSRRATGSLSRRGDNRGRAGSLAVDPSANSPRSGAALDSSRAGVNGDGSVAVADMIGSPPVPPRSMHEVNLDGAHLPSSVGDGDGDGGGDGGVKRTGSVRSRFDGTVRRRREGSAGTGTTVATATTVPGWHSHAAAMASAAVTPRPTGFAVASKKRNRDFHHLFRSVPEDDYLIEDYSAAIQKDILLHGRLYVSEGHICFNSNIFGYVTTLVISFDEIVSVEKKNTAMVFPNAVVIQTLHARNTFASLASRESTYDLIVGIWKIGHPNLRSSVNGMQLDEAGSAEPAAKTERSSSDGPGADDDEEEAVYDEDAAGDEFVGSVTEAGEGSMVGSDIVDGVGRSTLRQPSVRIPAARLSTGETTGVGDGKGEGSSPVVVPPAGGDYPGPATHRPTECGDQDRHYDRLIRDDVVPAPLGKVYSLIFGAGSGAFMTSWLLEEQKVLDLQMEDDKTGLAESKRSRSYSYVKPLYAAIGPKQTKCLITEVLDVIDFERAVSVTVTTQTPDVPSGNVFSVKTKYCLMWAEGNATRIVMNCTIEWSGKSWLKGPIEKGANEGQTTYAKDLIGALRVAVASKASASAVAATHRVRRRKRDVAEISAQAIGRPAVGVADAHRARLSPPVRTWGVLEPVRALAQPALDLIRPMLTPHLAMGVMALLLLASWLRPLSGSGDGYAPGRGRGRARGPYAGDDAAAAAAAGWHAPARAAAYEEWWRREESGLWDWLDERVGLDRLALARPLPPPTTGARTRTPLHAPPPLPAKLAEDRMSARQMDEAIRVTQNRLDDLRRMLARGREDDQPARPEPALAADQE
ncbi:MAG: hypothetical protein M1826_004378 [Phylliscum demangeonii]|nr:MAG: hypothetical protein M1826_004378 [Phylliscum demangeonii]